MINSQLSHQIEKRVRVNSNWTDQAYSSVAFNSSNTPQSSKIIQAGKFPQTEY